MNTINDKSNSNQLESSQNLKKASQVVSAPGVLTRSAVRKLAARAAEKRKSAFTIIKSAKATKPSKVGKATMSGRATVTKSLPYVVDTFIKYALDKIKAINVTKAELQDIMKQAVYYRNIEIFNFRFKKIAPFQDVNKAVTLSEIVLQATQLTDGTLEQEETALDALMVAETHGGVQFRA